jgi:hypothetical protein
MHVPALELVPTISCIAGGKFVDDFRSHRVSSPALVMRHVSIFCRLICLMLLASHAPIVLAAAPDFGPNVIVVDPSMPDVQAKIDAVYAKQEAAQFGSDRFALLFKPGKYNADVKVGFYTHVIGLGRSPDDVDITGAVRAKATWMRNNATCNFWRAAENFAVTPTLENNTNIWAVSQGVAMRRAHIKGNINLWDGGWSSGGFLADSKVDGVINSGSQQQWFSRNCDFGEWRGGNWNMVFVGCNGAPAGEFPDKPYTTIEQTPLVREKPFLIIDESDRYFVVVPDLHTEATRGISWTNGANNRKTISLDDFFIARADRDTASTINAALDSGKHLLVTPGMYHLDAPILVSRANTIVLGIGYPTLVPDKGTAAMIVSDVEGVKLAGLLLEANETESPTLLQIGEPGSSASHASNPIFLFDIFARAGGAVVGSADCFVVIHSNNVVGENLWLWRADHGAGAKWDVNKNRNGLIINGDDVTMYGLFVEHCTEHQTIWNGNGGRVYFYQSEMPYDPPTQEQWSHDGKRGYASYKVADKVASHEAWGLGVYCVFKAGPIVADTAIEAPDTDGVKLQHLIAVRLSGKPDSGIARGKICSPPPPDCSRRVNRPTWISSPPRRWSRAPPRIDISRALKRFSSKRRSTVPCRRRRMCLATITPPIRSSASNAPSGRCTIRSFATNRSFA